MAENKRFNPDLREILHDGEAHQISRYSLVTATAKLARQISDKAVEDKEIITEKPVSTALDKLLAGEYTIEEPEEIKDL
ncbi:MAG: DNA-directed RNA polymerase subunit omega [Clostridia bacterium]|nr:DNA-directed RNA polymerase subunit omega [Clostridia bacterium]MBR5015560.1 DNA-directed RNA polymerase subunit omega [Clostridia bacterium]MBR5976861.1 DNA-directed RNA polymerase subunit omega [Clostridia bacterium]MBR5992055.1 DNA-directed RNA polymerase subunit omega [Clostridia bacterium]MBR6479452.1 DNA-directed RNA polymerase subunit omega [Clostridia bacterium]